MKPPFRSWETKTRPCVLLWKAGQLGMEKKTPARSDADRLTLVFHTRCCPRSAPLPSAPARSPHSPCRGFSLHFQILCSVLLLPQMAALITPQV